MLSTKMTDALNAQINREMYSGYLYMAMSAQAEDMGLKGFAKWFMVQYHEEMMHAMKMYEYVQSQNERVALAAIDAPPASWDTVLSMFEDTLAHEQKVTAWINELMDIAIAEKDHATQIFLQWYVTEQIEEEGNDQEIIDKLKMIQGNPQGLYMLDKEMGARQTGVVTDFSNGIAAE
jgi:ferritin